MISFRNMEVIEKKGDYRAAKYGMWFFLFTELLFFGGMFLIYSAYRFKFPGEFHTGALVEDITLGTINTALLITSSLTLAIAISAVKRENYRLSVLLQTVTICLGAVFLYIKGSEWDVKMAMGLYPNSPVLDKLSKGEILYFGLYYVMTGIHALHVFIGIVVISIMIIFTVRRSVNSKNFSKLENTGLYWHFVDIVWMYLFPLFYLIT